MPAAHGLLQYLRTSAPPLGAPSAVTAGLPSSHVIIVGKGPGLWYPDLAAAVAVILPQIQQQMDALNNGGAG